MAPQKNKGNVKGDAAEEALRNYFRNLGAFVLRGIPLRQGNDDITDIDLWTYTRSSVHARHIAIVDIKNKKRSKGYERVIWLRGLQQALNADESIVASTSNREDLKPFADRIGVRLISQSVMQAILKRFESDPLRLTNEEVDDLWKAIRLDGPQTLYSRMRSNLEEVGKGISFPSINQWIDETGAMLTYAIDHERIAGPVLRACYLCTSLIALGGDYLGRKLSFSDQDYRRSFFQSGLLFGKTDQDAISSYLTFAQGLVTDFVDPTGASAAQMRAGFQSAIEQMPIHQFVEFFSKPTAGRELIDAALQLEAAAFAKRVPEPAELGAEAKTILLLVADFKGIKRRSVLRGMTVDTIENANLKPKGDDRTDLFGSK